MYLTNRSKDGDQIILHFKDIPKTTNTFQILLIHHTKEWKTLDVVARGNHLYEVRIDLEKDLLGKHIQVVYKSKNSRQLLTCFTLPHRLFADTQKKELDIFSYLDVAMSSETIEKEASLILKSMMKGR